MSKKYRKEAKQKQQWRSCWDMPRTMPVNGVSVRPNDWIPKPCNSNNSTNTNSIC